jgi:Domain of unknown function (DUF5664)
MNYGTLGNEAWVNPNAATIEQEVPALAKVREHWEKPPTVENEGSYHGALPAPASPMPPSTKPSNPKDFAGSKKAPMSTVSALVLAEVGLGMLEGALAYGRHNYRVVGVLASIYYDATIRHLRSWWEGEDIDPKSQLSHITKAITSLVVLRDAMIMEMFTDDRPPRHKDVSKFFADLDARAAELIERDGHINPVHYTETNKGG